MSLRRADVHGDGRPNSKAKLPEQEASLTISQPDSVQSEGVRKTKRQMVSSLFSRLKGSDIATQNGPREQDPGFDQQRRHEGLHPGEKNFVCRGTLQSSVSISWGCGLRFAHADALGQHFRSEAGRVCIKPLLDNMVAECLKGWLKEQQQAQGTAGCLALPRHMSAAPYHDPTTDFLPTVRLQQYPAGLDWSSTLRAFLAYEGSTRRANFCSASRCSEYDAAVLILIEASLFSLLPVAAGGIKDAPGFDSNQTTFDLISWLELLLLDSEYSSASKHLSKHCLRSSLSEILYPTANTTTKPPHTPTLLSMYPRCKTQNLHGSSSAEAAAQYFSIVEILCHPLQPLDTSAWRQLNERSDDEKTRAHRPAFPDDQVVNTSSAYGFSNVQPLYGLFPSPTSSLFAGCNASTAGSGSGKATVPSGQRSPSASTMSSSTPRLGKLRQEDAIQPFDSKSHQPHTASTLMTRAQDDTSLGNSPEEEHLRSTNTASPDDILSQTAQLQELCRLDLGDYSTAGTDKATPTTAQTVSEDASIPGSESDSDDCYHRTPSQSPCGEDFTTSDLDEHELTQTVAGPSLVHAAPSRFGEARLELERLRLGIETLEDGSESSSDISRSEPDILTDIDYSWELDIESDVSGSTNDNEEGSESHHGDTGSSRINAVRTCVTGTLGSTAQANCRKRQRLCNANDGGARAEVSLSEKRSKLASKRFKCCFRDGPGQKCLGTDETICEVLKNLSDHHDTHVCDRCWALKVRDESSGLFVHPPDCLDHCLSPQCHETTPTMGYRHEFHPDTCGGRKTSRVRPGDGEAAYRFIFSLIHPALQSPAEVVTAEHSLHRGAMPRQGRRKATREELTTQADHLGRRLKDLERKHVEETNEISRLKQELSDGHSTIERNREKTASLEAKMRRVVAILGDALRTGVFRDQQGHRSLLMRVGEDAPDALGLFSHPSPSPPESTTGQQPCFMPTREKKDVTAQCQLFQDAYPMILNSAAFDQTPHGSSYGTRASQQATTAMSLGDQNMDIDWLNLVDEPENPSNVSAYTDDLP
jgi:hypothetical protein